MNKRKIILLATALCMVAILAVGGTLAYFTDTDVAVNTFTVGNVKIELIEEQRTLDAEGRQPVPGSEIVEFTQDKKLFPLVGSAQTSPKDKYGLTEAQNYVDKIITVAAKKGSEDCFIRVYVAIPAALDSVDPGANVLHFNIGNRYFADGSNTAGAENPDHNTYWRAETPVGTYEEDGIKYNVYYRTYAKELKAEQVTGSAAYVGFYLDAGVDCKDGKWYVTREGETTEIDYNLSNGVKIPVIAIGVQSEGFDDADVALDAAFGANYNAFDDYVAE